MHPINPTKRAACRSTPPPGKTRPDALEPDASAQQDRSPTRIGQILPETGAAEASHRIAEIAVIEEVEKFAPEFQVHPFRNRELLDHGDILRVQSRPPEGVLSKVAERHPRIGQRQPVRAQLRHHDARTVQWRAEAAVVMRDGVQRNGPARIEVRTRGRAADAVGIHAVQKRERLALLRLRDAVQRPSAHYALQHRIAEQTRLEPWNVVVEKRHVAVLPVERRDPVFAAVIAEVLRNLRAAGSDRAHAQRFVVVAHVLAEGIVEAHQQAVAQLFVQLHVQGVVVADAVRFDQNARSIQRIDAARLGGRNRVLALGGIYGVGLRLRQHAGVGLRLIDAVI